MDTLLDRTVRSRALWHKLEKHLPKRTRARGDGRREPDFHRTAWGDAAAAEGVAVTDIGGGFFEIQCPTSVLRVYRNITSLDDAVTAAIAADKPLVHELLARHGLPVPSHCVCGYREVATAWAFVGRRDRPCVVKPAHGTGGGTGITMDVSTRKRLVAAMGRAGSYCEKLVIEDQLAGDNYRLLYLDGRLIDALLRRPPQIIGDGVSTVRELVEAREPGASAPRPGPWVARGAAWRFGGLLRETGRGPDDVPAAGESVRLRRVVNMHDRQDNESVTGTISAAVVEAGAQAAAAVGVRLAGVDIITPDRSVPLAEAGGAIIEVNTGPGLHYHYMTSGEPTPVASLILRQLCETDVRQGRPTKARSGRGPTT